MKDKNKIIILSVLVLFIGFCIFVSKNNKNELVLNTNQDTKDVNTDETICFYKETWGQGESVKIVDKNLITLKFDNQRRDVGTGVSGIINWIPQEKDSNVGSYVGKIIKKESDGTLFIDALSTSYGEGIKFNQQEIIKVTSENASIGIGEKKENTQGVFVYKDLTDLNKLSFETKLDKVSCSSVPPNINKDYTKEIR